MKSDPSISISELIGLIILFLAFLSSIIRRVWEFFDRRKHPEKYLRKETEGEDVLQGLMQAMGGDAEPPKPVVPSPQPLPPEYKKPSLKQGKFPGRSQRESKRTVSNDFQFRAGLDSHHRRSAIDDRHLQSSIESRSANDLLSSHIQEMELSDAAGLVNFDSYEESPASQIVHQLDDPAKLVIIYEIFSPPASLREGDGFYR